MGEEVEDVWDYDCVARGVLGSLVGVDGALMPRCWLGGWDMGVSWWVLLRCVAMFVAIRECFIAINKQRHSIPIYSGVQEHQCPRR